MRLKIDDPVKKKVPELRDLKDSRMNGNSVSWETKTNSMMGQSPNSENYTTILMGAKMRRPMKTYFALVKQRSKEMVYDYDHETK